MLTLITLVDTIPPSSPFPLFHPSLNMETLTSTMLLGYAWQTAAFALEKASRDKQMLGLDINLGRIEDFAAELAETGLLEVPEHEIWDRWQFDKRKLDRLVDQERRKK